jgi:hypothetical protein
MGLRALLTVWSYMRDEVMVLGVFCSIIVRSISTLLNRMRIALTSPVLFRGRVNPEDHSSAKGVNLIVFKTIQE